MRKRHWSRSPSTWDRGRSSKPLKGDERGGDAGKDTRPGPFVRDTDTDKQLTDLLHPLLAMVLCLSSDEPEITETSGNSPSDRPLKRRSTAGGSFLRTSPPTGVSVQRSATGCGRIQPAEITVPMNHHGRTSGTPTGMATGSAAARGSSFITGGSLRYWSGGRYLRKNEKSRHALHGGFFMVYLN